MKKFILPIFICVCTLSSCLETVIETSIEKDGSGHFVFLLDMREAIQQKVGESPGEDFKVDTTIYMRNYSDTAQTLTANQKALLREMEIRVNVDFRSVENLEFKFSFHVPFKSMSDLDELDHLIKQKEFDQLFDKANRIPGLDDDTKDDGGQENDNIIALVSPAFLDCKYQPGNINCRLDSLEYRKSLELFRSTGMNMEGENEQKLMSTIRIIRKITLPSKPKKLVGKTLLAGTKENELVQTTSLYELYKNPGSFAYSVQW